MLITFANNLIKIYFKMTFKLVRATKKKDVGVMLKIEIPNYLVMSH